MKTRNTRKSRKTIRRSKRNMRKSRKDMRKLSYGGQAASSASRISLLENPVIKI